MAVTPEEIDFIIGAPPVNSTEDGPSRARVITNAMPLVYIQPGTPDFTQGLDLMSRKPAFSSGATDTTTLSDVERVRTRESYLSNLNKLGFTLKQPTPSKQGFLTCAFLADSFPTDNFTNEYGENFLQGITNVASEGLSGVAQMMGARDLTSAVDKMVTGGKEAAGEGLVGDMLGSIAEFNAKIDQLGAAGAGGGGMLGRIVQNVNVLAAGGRIDFPMLWKNSTYSPSYTMTIRLYNPNPASERSTSKYIIGPLAALLLLGLPQSVGEGTYSWPYIHQFWAPGIYNLDPAYISNITVVKGGDQQQIAWNQKMGVVDVRLDFASVFNSILSNAASSRNRPTLKGYLEALGEQKNEVYGLTDTEQINNEDNRTPAMLQTTKNIGDGGTLTQKEIRNHVRNLTTQRRDQSTTQSKTQLDITEPDETISPRVTQAEKDIESDLVRRSPI